MDYNKLKVGVNVRVKSSQEIYEGKVKYWDASKQRLTIDSVYNHNTRKNIAGLLHFYQYDIESLQVLEESRSVDSNNNYTLNNSGDGYVSSDNEYRPIKQRHSESLKSTETVILNNNNNISNISNGINNGLTIDDLQQFPYLLIVDMNSAMNVMNGLMNSECIGFRLYGELKRYGKLSLICITVKNEAYLFDFLSIINEYDENELKFMNLLSKLLSNSNVIKVIHDSRFISDMLYHQYQIELKNVFDVQVAYLTIYKDNCGKYPTNSTTIEQMINEFYPNEIRLNKLISCNDGSNYERINWSQRPLNIKMKFISLYQTISLIDIYNILYSKLLERFRSGCDLYLSIIRDCKNNEQLNELYKNKDKVPFELDKIRVSLSTENEIVTKKSSTTSTNNHNYVRTSQIAATKPSINTKPINKSMSTGFGDVKQEKLKTLSYDSDYNLNGDSVSNGFESNEESGEQKEKADQMRMAWLQKIKLYPEGFTPQTRTKKRYFYK